MLELVVLVAMLTLGIGALAKGRIKLTARRSVEGGPARLIGVILLLPLPLYIGIALLASLTGIVQALRPARPPLWLGVTALGLVVGAVVVSVLIATFTAKPIDDQSAEAEDEGGGVRPDPDQN